MILVLPDAILKAGKEGGERVKFQGEAGKNGKKYRAEVQKIMEQPLPAPINNSSRMQEADLKVLADWEKQDKQRQKVEFRNKIRVKKAKKDNQSAEIQSAQPETGTSATTDEIMMPDGESKGTPTVETKEESETNGSNTGNNSFLSGYISSIDPDFYVRGSAYDSSGYGASISVYIDNNYIDTTYCYGGGGCSWQMEIPVQYRDGQQHSLTAFGYDYYSGWQEELGNSPMNFTFGPPPVNPNWNNNNWNTADNPGVQPGNPANTGTDGVGSSNFSFSAPVISLGGRGMDVNLSLSYNSLLWHQAGSTITYDIDKGNPAPGWNIGFGKLMDMDTQGGSMIEDLDGTRHSYEGTIQPGYSSGYSTYYGRTTDGSFIDYESYRTPSGISGGVANLANGTQIIYGAAANGVAYPTQIKDRHGNLMTVSYQNNQGPNISQVTDNLGRAIVFNYDGNNRLVSVTGPAQNGGTRVYVRIHYNTLNLTQSFSGLNPGVRNANPAVIDAIYYPDTNLGYWFGDGGSSPSYSSYGMLTKVMEMRGMGWSGANNNDQGSITMGTMSRQMVYNYPLTAANLTAAPQYTTMTETWADMTSNPAVTGYNVNNNASPRTTTITLPNGNKIKQSSYNAPNQPNDGLLYQVETLSPSNQVLAKSVTNWQAGDYNTNRVTQIESTDEKNQTTKQTFTYDSYYNQVATVSEYGYSNNLFRKKVNTYENGANYRGNYNGTRWVSGRHIFSLVKTEEVLDASNNRLSRNDYSYDQAPLVNTPNVVMYDQTFNPHTTQTIQGPNCVQWDQYWVNEYDPPYYGGYWESYCVQYEQISAYNSTTAARGNVTNTTTYAEASNLTGAISYDSTYDIVGNARTTTTNCCQQMSFSYSTATQYSQPDSHTKGSSDPNSPHRMTESATYDFNTGLLKSATDFNGRTTSYNYDAANRPEATFYPTGLHTQIWYHPNINQVNELIWQGSSYTSVENIFNGRGQQIKRSEYRPNNLSNYWDAVNWTDSEITYDQMGRKLTASVPHQRNVASAGNTTYQYDILSRVVQVTAPDGSTSKTFYNEATKPSSAASNVGNTVRSQDAWGRERWARTDDFGRLVEVVEPDPNGNGSVFAAGNMVTSYTYNPKDELTQVNQGNQLRAFKYDSLGRLTRQKLAEQNGTLNDAGQFVGANQGPWSDTFVYDNRSNLIQRTDARGVKTNFNYQLGGAPDPLNRLQNVTYDKSGADTTYNIVDASPVYLSYMTSGDKTRVWKADTWNSSEENSYDIEGGISEYKMTFAGRPNYPMVTSYLYDTMNRLTEVRYPAQYGMAGSPRKVVTPSYDSISRLSQLKVDNQIQMSEIQYNPMSQVTQLKTGAGTGNALVEQYSYDQQTGLLTNQKVVKQNSNTSLLDLSYEYNRGNSKGSINGKTGQLTHVVDNLNRNKDRVYEFDTLGRLQVAKGGGATGVGGVQANWTQTYGYDRYGNRISVSASGVMQNNQAVPTDGLATQSYDNATNRITTAGYVYDLAGNLIRSQKEDGTWQVMEYDCAGRLFLVKRESDNWMQQVNGYGSSRQRTYSWSFASAYITFYVGGGSSVIAEYNGQGSTAVLEWQKSYIYAGSRLLSTFTKDGSNEKLEFHHPDRLGTRLVTNNQANTSFEQNTLPFGTALDGESTGASNQRFTSYDRSSVASLDYAVNRSYSSGQGRFTSVDPIGFGASSLGNPQSLNLFAYVENNPIDFTDPTGLLRMIDYSSCREIGWIFVNNGDGTGSVVWISVCDTYSIDPIVNPEPGGGGGGTTPLPNDLKERVVDITNNCKDFMNKFLDQLSKFGKLHSRDFGTLFDRVGSNNIFLKKQKKGVGAVADQGPQIGAKRQIPIDPRIDDGSNPDTEQANYNNYAKDTIAELLHHSREGSHDKFSDKQLDMAAVNMLPEKDRPAALQEVERLRKMHPTGSYGSYGHRAVNQNCQPTNPYGPPPKQN